MSDVLSVAQLKSILRSLSVPHTGYTQNQLSDRVRDRLAWRTRVRDLDLEGLTVPELRDLLRESMFQKHWRYKRRPELLRVIRALAEAEPTFEAPRKKTRPSRRFDLLVWTHPVSGRRVWITTRRPEFQRLRLAAERVLGPRSAAAEIDEISNASEADHDAMEPTELEHEQTRFILDDHAGMLAWSPSQRAERERLLRRMLG